MVKKLPKDLISLIGLYLELNDLINYSLINKHTYDCTMDSNVFWWNKTYKDTGLKLNDFNMKEEYKYYTIFENKRLCRAARNGNKTAVEMALKNGATDIHNAFLDACYGGNLDIVKFLSKKVISFIHIRGLEIARKMANKEVVEWLECIMTTCPTGSEGVGGPNGQTGPAPVNN